MTQAYWALITLGVITLLIIVICTILDPDD